MEKIYTTYEYIIITDIYSYIAIVSDTRGARGDLGIDPWRSTEACAGACVG